MTLITFLMMLMPTLHVPNPNALCALTGGLDAAIEGIMAGKYKPLDFRFFVGSNEYVNGELDAKVLAHKYQPVACARSVILKQCIQLPKPLWHEVIELCGGEMRELSHLEMMKREDLK